MRMVDNIDVQILRKTQPKEVVRQMKRTRQFTIDDVKTANRNLILKGNRASCEFRISERIMDSITAADIKTAWKEASKKARSAVNE